MDFHVFVVRYLESIYAVHLLRMSGMCAQPPTLGGAPTVCGEDKHMPRWISMRDGWFFSVLLSIKSQCGGNANNFNSLEECEGFCLDAQCEYGQGFADVARAAINYAVIISIRFFVGRGGRIGRKGKWRETRVEQWEPDESDVAPSPYDRLTTSTNNNVICWYAPCHPPCTTPPPALPILSGNPSRVELLRTDLILFCFVPET
ncbi:hypothetical protein KIN20_015845 [Parelaphostrongylus tenuis]|uniref:BPTI/Kunitz inhibitor domain-containing protein n=1 Tax=Parelaphostrongylus tenuis TaxID=148309 RepID=A0AAD5MFL0_PARTN|nr:hypothetical protein KIN20_015845 [Parelaphostrongylus tenuis]